MHTSLIHRIAVIAVLAGLPLLQGQPFEGKGLFRLLSAYQDDPSLAPPVVGWIDTAEFGYTQDWRRVLRGPQVLILDEDKIYRRDPKTGQFEALAWNPWPEPTANPEGEFVFADEERFPLFKPERGPDGAIVRRDGLQLWGQVDLRLGMNTAFDAAVAVKAASEHWAGRPIRWGVRGVLEINAHAFVDLNAFYSPSARSLFFGVVPYRLPGETEAKLFETANSFDIAAHEAGHAAHWTLKPNAIGSELQFRAWGESFGDQVAMWSSLRHRDRARRLLNATQGDLRSSNALSRISEVHSLFFPEATGLRDAFHSKKISDTEAQEHDRSKPLTGAAYNVFLAIYDELKGALEAEQALRTAGDIMGVFLVRAVDFTPENHVTLEDVGKAYLKVDKEFFQGRYHTLLVDEFLRREIFNAGSVGAWLAHEEGLPGLHVPPGRSDEEIESLIKAHQAELGIGPDFGLLLQSVTRTNGSGMSAALEQTIVRVQLTQGSGKDAVVLNNHGILVFRADGTLADYHSPLPQGPSAPASAYLAQVQALSAIRQARQLRMPDYGVPLTLVRRPNGQIAAEAHVIRGEGLNTYMEVFTPGNPRPERREILVPPIPPDRQIHIPDDLLK